MKCFLFIAVMCLILVTPAYAYRKGSHPSLEPNYSHDAYGHLTRNDNLWNDTDSDGVTNYYDSNDSNNTKW